MIVFHFKDKFQLRWELTNSLAVILQAFYKENLRLTIDFIEPHILVWKNPAFGYEKMPSINYKKIIFILKFLLPAKLFEKEHFQILRQFW